MAKSRSALTRITIMQGTQADISTRNAALKEARLAARTEDNELGYSLDAGTTWYFPNTSAQFAAADTALQAQITALQASNLALQKANAYWHGFLQTGVTVNAFATGNTTIDTTDAGTKFFYPRTISLSVRTRTGSPVLALINISVGYTAPNYNELGSFAVANLVGLTVIGATVTQAVTNASRIPVSTPIVARVSGIATGIGATLTYAIDVLGAYKT